MGTEENYLDNLLKSITDPKPDEAKQPTAEQISEIKEEEVVRDGQMNEEIKLMPEPDEAQDVITVEPVPEELPAEFNIADIPEADVSDQLDVPDVSDVSEELNITDIPELLDVPEEPEQLEIADIPELSEEPEQLEIADILEEPERLEIADIPELPEEPEQLEIADIPELSEEPEQLEIADIPELSEEPEQLEIADIPELSEEPEQLEIADIPELPEEPEQLEIADIPEELDISDISAETDSLELPETLETSEVSDVSEMHEGNDAEELSVAEENNENIEEAIPDLEALQGLGDLEAFGDSDLAENLGQIQDEADLNTELDMDDLDIPEIPDTALAEETDMVLDIDGLETKESSQSETELGMSDELNLDELDLDTPDLDTSELDAPNMDGDLALLDSMDSETKDNSVPGVDDGLDDVLSMLDDDADLAEINDILKKSDSNEPIQDEMMDLLNQMADDEAALVNAGVKSIEDDGGVSIPDMSPEMEQTDSDSQEDGSSKKKKKNKDGEKKPGAIGKLFNLLTEELPGPTEEDYAAEDAKKAAKKQEALTKKEEEKLAKEEEKQAKAAEKEAAKKAKAEAAAQKKKEKQEAKAKKAAEKLAKQGPVKKAKRIPPKKIAAVAVFGASVFGGVMVATNVLSSQAYLNIAKKAFYDGNYKDVYLATYGMELRDSDALIQEKSEVILKMQRWYDSYQNNRKLGREREALDALIRSFETYDYINGEAEEYGVLNEVETIKGTILDVLQSEYGLGEEQARELLQYEDALDYTMALNNIITDK